MKTSELTPAKLISEIKKSDLGILFIERNTKSFIDELAKCALNQSVGICDNNNVISCKIYSIKYSRFSSVELRSEAVWDIFNRWTAFGYNTHNAKSPYGCKAFHDIFDKICNADYIIIKDMH